MIGDRQRVQSESNALLDQFLGIAHPIQEAEIAVTVQLRVRHHFAGRTLDPLLVRLVRRPFVRVSRSVVAVWIVRGVVRHGPPGHPTLEFAPGIGGLFQPIYWPFMLGIARSNPPTSSIARRRRALSAALRQFGGRVIRRSQIGGANIANSVIACFRPPLVVLHDQQPGAAVKAGDLKPRNLACLVRVPPQFVNGPWTSPGIDRHQLRPSPMPTKAGAALTSPRSVMLTGLWSSLSTIDGIGAEKTWAGAGGGIEPGHGSW